MGFVAQERSKCARISDVYRVLNFAGEPLSKLNELLNVTVLGFLCKRMDVDFHLKKCETEISRDAGRESSA